MCADSAAPAPFKIASAEALKLATNETFQLHIGVEPKPLYDYLEQRGFQVESSKSDAGDFLITITALQHASKNGDEQWEPPQPVSPDYPANP